MRRRKLREDPVLYRIEYSRIAQALHDASRGESAPESQLGLSSIDSVRIAVEATHRNMRTLRNPPPPSAAGGAVRALELLEWTAPELRRLGWRWAGGKPTWYVRWMRRRQSSSDLRFGQFLDRVVEPATVVLYWSWTVEQDPKRLRGLLATPEARRRRVNRHWFALKWNRERRRRGPWLEDYLTALRSSEQRSPRRLWRVLGRFGAWLGIRRLQPMPPPAYRVSYNLACLCSRMAARVRVIGLDPDDDFEAREDALVEEAREHLLCCVNQANEVERAAIAQWARRDPALSRFRESEALEPIVGPVE